jgi:hypothetical protein
MRAVFPEGQNIEHPDRLILTIYTGPDHLSFSLYDPEVAGSYFYNEEVVSKASCHDEILAQTHAFTVFNKKFFKQSFFSLPFRKVQIMCRTPNFAFIPDSIYKTGRKEDFMQFLFSDQHGITMAGSTPSAGITVLYQLPEDVYQLLNSSFSEPEFIHFSTPLISYFIKKSKALNTRQMIVNLQENGLDIFCFSRDVFLLGNYFQCKSLQEMVYYILYAWKQLQLNQLDDYLHIMGNTAFREELIDHLTLYIQHIRYPLFPQGIHFKGIETKQIPFELATLTVCES